MDKKINFKKRMMIFNIVDKIQKRQQVGYNFQQIPQIARLLVRVQIRDEQELYKLSLKAEPRGKSRAEIM